MFDGGGGNLTSSWEMVSNWDSEKRNQFLFLWAECKQVTSETSTWPYFEEMEVEVILVIREKFQGYKEKRNKFQFLWVGVWNSDHLNLNLTLI